MPPHLLGWLCLLLTATTWVGASFLAQFLVSGDQPSLHPFLLVYVCTSLFSLWVPVIAIKRRCEASRWRTRRRTAAEAGGVDRADAEQALLPGDAAAAADDGNGGSSAADDGGAAPELFPDHTRLGAALKVLPVACMWFAAQYTFTLSLANTSVTSNTILSSSSSMWTLLASAAVLRERITCVKLAAVAAVMAGTAAVAVADSGSSGGTGGGGGGGGGGPDRSLWGDFLCLLSAWCYSLYTVTMQRQLRQDDPDVPALYFGWIGVLAAALGLPVVAALHCLGAFDLAALDPRALGLAVLNGLLDYVIGDYTWARAVLLLGPTAATLGTSVQIPLATLADTVLGHPHWMDSRRAVALTAAGTALILAGVAGVNWVPRQQLQQQLHSSSADRASSVAGTRPSDA